MKKGKITVKFFSRHFHPRVLWGVRTYFKLHFLPSYLDFSPKNMEASPINMAKVSIRIFPKLKRSTVENGVKRLWLTAA